MYLVANVIFLQTKNTEENLILRVMKGYFLDMPPTVEFTESITPELKLLCSPLMLL
jgi:hypothetical protein